MTVELREIADWIAIVAGRIEFLERGCEGLVGIEGLREARNENSADEPLRWGKHMRQDVTSLITGSVVVKSSNEGESETPDVQVVCRLMMYVESSCHPPPTRHITLRLASGRVLGINLHVTTLRARWFENAYCAFSSSVSLGTLRSGGSRRSISKPWASLRKYSCQLDIEEVEMLLLVANGCYFDV